MTPYQQQTLFAAASCFALVFGYKAARERGGVLRLLSRSLDHARACLYCANICCHCAIDEWSRMYECCLARARRDR